jgi:hypothetical protein
LMKALDRRRVGIAAEKKGKRAKGEVEDEE